MLAQLLNNRNNNDTGSNHDEEEHHSNEQPKESPSMDAEVLKGIQAQIASLTQRDELKKVGAVRHYPLE